MIEFVDTNVFAYAHDSHTGQKHRTATKLIAKLFEAGTGAISTQILVEFYAVATKKLGMTSEAAEEVLADLSGWTIHCPTHADILEAARLQRRYQDNWWDALLVNSAIQSGCATLWTEDLSHGQRYGTVTVRNPFL